MDSWDETSTIMVGDRRMRVRRRRAARFRVQAWLVLVVLILATAGGYSLYRYLTKPKGLDAISGNAVLATGAFQARVVATNTIAVAMEVRNATASDVILVSARMVAPAGLTQLDLSVLPPGDHNSNLNLTGALPPSTPITLGTSGVERNGIVAARFQVACAALPSAAATGERVFVTVRLGNEEREEEVTPPVVAGVQWLTATARTACNRPSASFSAPAPLPPMPSA